jgi:hypothetical protein
VFSCFHVFVSCIVWVMSKKKLSLNSKQLIIHENTKTLNYGQKMHSVYSPLYTVNMSLMLFKTYKNPIPSREWLVLNHTNCIGTSTSSYNVGFNIPTRQLTVINNQMDFECLDLSKVKCTKLFLLCCAIERKIITITFKNPWLALIY